MQLQTAVSVLKHGILSVHAPNETLTNVHIPTKGYSFIVKLDGSHSQDIKTAQDTIDILFDCRVDPPYVGYVKPWKDFDTGNSYCLFFPYPPEHSIFSSPESRSMGQEMSVSISASLKRRETCLQFCISTVCWRLQHSRSRQRLVTVKYDIRIN